MSGPRHDVARLAPPIAAAGAVVGLGMAGHVAAGGDVAFTAPVAVTTTGAVVAAVAATVLGKWRWTFTRLVAATSLAQPVLHWVLDHEHGAGPHAGSSPVHAHGHHDHLTSVGPSVETMSGAAGWAMLFAHAALAVVAAVSIRWGVRWLRAMTRVVRAFVLARRLAATLLAQFGRVRAAPHEFVAVAELTRRAARGPPVRA